MISVFSNEPSMFLITPCLLGAAYTIPLFICWGGAWRHPGTLRGYLASPELILGGQATFGKSRSHRFGTKQKSASQVLSFTVQPNCIIPIKSIYLGALNYILKINRIITCSAFFLLLWRYSFLLMASGKKYWELYKGKGRKQYHQVQYQAWSLPLFPIYFQSFGSQDKNGTHNSRSLSLKKKAYVPVLEFPMLIASLHPASLRVLGVWTQGLMLA